MKSIDFIKLSKNASIKKALEIINSGAMQIALVVDENNRLIGTVTDGDVRRGLLAGLDLNSSIESVVFKTPTTAKITETKENILKLAVAKKLRQIPIINDDGIVLGIQEIDELVKPSNKTNKVILMVGGLGSRLKELTKDTPKPMLKVGNKPILQTIIEKFAEYGYINIILCVNYKSHVIEEYFKDGSEFGVNIEYVYEKQRMGTVGALSLLKNLPSEPFFVMNGDILTSINFEHLQEYHMQNNAMATMCVREYDMQVPYGVVHVEDGKIKTIKEKPTHKFFVSGGIYMLSPEVLKCIPQNEFYDMPTLFEKLIKMNENVVSFSIQDYWLDIGRMEEYKRANDEYGEVF